VKALSDVICTSSNAEKIVNSFPQGTKIVFAPDRHLGAWVEKKTGRTWSSGRGSASCTSSSPSGSCTS